MSASVWAVTRESISPKTKEIRLDLRNRIVDAHKAGDRHTKLSERFQVSRTGVRSIVKKFKDEYRTSPAEIESKGFQRLQARLNYAKDKPVERLRILETLGMDRRFVFQHDNDPKHLLLLARNYLQKTKVKVTDMTLILLKICELNWRWKSPPEEIWEISQHAFQSKIT